MKRAVCLLVVMLSASCKAQLTPLHDWTATLSVVDELGQPVAGARAWVAYGSPKEGESPDPFQPNDWAIAGLTDANGVFVASHRDHSFQLGFHAQKAGHYSTFQQHFIGFSPQEHPERLNPSVTLVLRKIGRPIPMYAKSVNLGMPVFDQPAGFDLTVGDWVTPYGKGVTSDIVFTAHLQKRSAQDSDFRLRVTFPNRGDGIQESSVSETAKRSGMRLPHEAPAAGYRSEWVQTSSRRPGKAVETNRHEDRNYFFRVRSVSDDKGNVQSALYGKIYGDFLKFRYYLNPTPNDRNVEFDPKKNLLQGLKPTEQVNEP